MWKIIGAVASVAETTTYWRETRRERHARQHVKKTLEQTLKTLSELEQYALNQGVIFMWFHESLREAIRNVDLTLSDYDGRF